jgi:hypothetical protein
MPETTAMVRQCLATLLTAVRMVSRPRRSLSRARRSNCPAECLLCLSLSQNDFLCLEMRLVEGGKDFVRVDAGRARCSRQKRSVLDAGRLGDTRTVRRRGAAPGLRMYVMRITETIGGAEVAPGVGRAVVLWIVIMLR